MSEGDNGSRQASEAPTTILLVDDNDLLRSLVRRFLEHQGCSVLEAAAPAQALALAGSRNIRIDALVAELSLPGLSGPDLLDQIPQTGREIPALYYSSTARHSGRPLGPREVFLQKPFGMTEFLLTLGALLPEGRLDRTRHKTLPVRPSHLLKIYEEDEGLAKTVAPYVIEGLQAGESVVVIASRPHWAAIARTIQDKGVEWAESEKRGALKVLDAHETLKQLQSQAGVDHQRFETLVDELIEPFHSGARQGPVRIYGEMVDLLWQGGRLDAALALEGLWNVVLTQAPCRLLCGYHRSLMTGSDAGAFTKVSETHSHILLA